MRTLRLVVTLVVTISSSIVGVGLVSSPIGAAANRFPHTVVNGFSTPSGAGYWLVYADGSVRAYGDAQWRGDASSLPLKGPIVGGAVTPNGGGYWLVASDGGIFSYGSARFHGSMGAAHLNQPIFSMSATRSGKGYWLVARDGGMFSFGNAKFHGSTGNLQLRAPIVGITTSNTARGYRLVARDGGVFSFGDASYYGSLPSRGQNVDNVVGTAPTPTNRGYWIAESFGWIDHFGDANRDFNPYIISYCDPLVAIFSNPKAQGYRVVTQSGATLPFGNAPGGRRRTGNLRTGGPLQCPPSVPSVNISP